MTNNVNELERKEIEAMAAAYDAPTMGKADAALANTVLTVESPPHYNSHPSGVECIEITEHHNFCIGNAIKYLWRAGLKDGQSTETDLKKAIWYINRELKNQNKK